MRNADVQVELVALALGSIRDQIIIAAQDALHAERGAASWDRPRSLTTQGQYPRDVLPNKRCRSPHEAWKLHYQYRVDQFRHAQSDATSLRQNQGRSTISPPGWRSCWAKEKFAPTRLRQDQSGPR
jgi:hypothetical protein